jgi:hypothetical protein
MLLAKNLSECSDAAHFWRVLNNFTGRKQKNSIPTLTNSNGVEMQNDEDKAEALKNVFFASVFTKYEPTQQILQVEPNALFEPSMKTILNSLKRIKCSKAQVLITCQLRC